jgi:hypothetical protein
MAPRGYCTWCNSRGPIVNAIAHDRVSSAFERHTQTALVMLLVALLLWVGNTTQQTSIEVAELKVEIRYLKNAITDLKEE